MELRREELLRNAALGHYVLDDAFADGVGVLDNRRRRRIAFYRRRGRGRGGGLLLRRRGCRRLGDAGSAAAKPFTQNIFYRPAEILQR